MSNLTQEIVCTAEAIAPTMSLEPNVRMSFTDADLVMVAAVMGVLISKGVDTLDRIHGYLAKRGCRFDREVIAFVLRVYDGRDRRANLWLRAGSDRYRLLH